MIFNQDLGLDNLEKTFKIHLDFWEASNQDQS
jgi:hypothetical protein